MKGVLEETLSAEHAMAVRMAMTMLATVPISELQAAVNRISLLTTTGPLFDPSAWLDGVRKKNAQEWTELLNRLIALRRVTPELVVPGEASRGGA